MPFSFCWNKADARSQEFGDVKLGETYGNTIAVTEGVKEGDASSTTGVTLVRDGDAVKVIP